MLEATTCESAPIIASLPDCYLIFHNVSKKSNLGTLARCATAFNVKAICVVGCREFQLFGSHGADIFVAFRHFKTLEECCDILRCENCDIIGIEIIEDALPISTYPFNRRKSTAFMLGNEGQGMTDRQINLCDSFVYIPQYGVGTASLNVAVAASIVLHTYAVWAGYSERKREGYKFVVAARPQRTAKRGCAPLSVDEKAQRAATRALNATEDVQGFDFSDLSIDWVGNPEAPI